MSLAYSTWSDFFISYPNNFCSGATDSNTNISAYLTHTTGMCDPFFDLTTQTFNTSRHITVPSYTSWNSAGVLAAAEANVPVVMTEFNTCSCGGSPTISPTVSIFPFMSSFQL